MKKKMNLKGRKRKKKNKIKLLIYSLIIYATFSYSFYYFMKSNEKIGNEEFINMLVRGGNANIISNYKTVNIINSTVKLLMGIDFRKPNTIMNETILRYGKIKKKKSKTISLSYNDDYSNMQDLMEVSDYIKDPNPNNNDSPIIYLYNSHQLENYNNDNLDIYGVTPNVLMASYLLKEKLNGMGINTLVEDANMSEILSNNNWEYYKSYDASRGLILDKIKKHPSLKYFIDIHRDSSNKSITTSTIDNKKYAKILFVIGKDYSTWQNNYNLANSLNDLINKYYSGLSRGIITKSGMDVNGVYNQDINSNVILIEVGGVDNNIDEVNNTIDALSFILYKYIKG